MKRRIVTVILMLTVCMAVSACSGRSKTYTSGDYDYRLLEDGSAMITKYSGKQSILTVPSKLDGHTVTSIGISAFSGCGSLTSVTLQAGVTIIDQYAFSDCGSLTAIRLPNGVTSIGNSAFRGCGRLTSITLPDSVKSIGDSAFRDCRSLTTIKMPAGIRSIGAYAFLLCGLTGITLPNGVTDIGDSAFRGCNSLTEITLPASITHLGTNPWQDCLHLETINVSPDHPTLAVIEGVLYSKADKRLVRYSLRNSKSSFEVPDGVEVIDDGAFTGCYSLTSITLPDSVKRIGHYAFWFCIGLPSIDLPESVTYIGNCAFANCTGLRSITLPDHLTYLGKGAFEGCRMPMTIFVAEDSYTETLCVIRGYRYYQYKDSPDPVSD